MSGQWLREWKPLVGGIGAGLLVVACFAGFILLIDSMIPSQKEVRALCDTQVKALLHSTDLVEVTRAGILIRRLDCSIRRRLPP